MFKKWGELPTELRNDSVKKYHEILSKKRCSLVFKRIFDVVASLVLLLILSPLFLILAVAIKLDSKGPVFYRQERVTAFNRRFRIFKFRSMFTGSDEKTLVTVNDDNRITKVGAFIRRFRLDEISQLVNVLLGDMTFVGTRPEVPRYTAYYTDEMKATLLLPAGVTSLASVYFKDEAELLLKADDADREYVENILPLKMHYNLKAIENFGFFNDIKIMFMTVFAVLGKNYLAEEAKTEEKIYASK